MVTGNCPIWALLDQMKYDPIHKLQHGMDVFEFHQLIVNYLPEFIHSGHIYWDIQTGGSIEAWMEIFSQNYVFPEQEFIQMAKTFLNRKIDSKRKYYHQINGLQNQIPVVYGEKQVVYYHDQEDID